jgi:dTDP-4-amino-4,6-dideoxygalactose transaminase
MSTDVAVALSRPVLPAAEEILPYLRELDEQRIYSNFGPLVARLEGRLAQHFGLPEGGVSTFANGTVALVAGLRAATRGRSGICLVPSWTFCASAHAIVGAGLQPYFLDVDPQTWQLDVEGARRALRDVEGVVAVMPVAPFGNPVDVTAWDAFAAETGVAVVIDAASAFAAQRPGRSLTMVSLHATKILSTGEGGLLMSSDPELVHETHVISNFGFDGTREARMPAMNGKLSEHAAAVGLASLDAWPRTEARWRAVVDDYIALLEETCMLRLPGGGRQLTAAWLAEFNLDERRVAAALAAATIPSRQWWGRGTHTHAAFATCPRTALPVTEALAARTCSLPLHLQMSRQDMELVVEALQSLRARA